MQNPFEKLDMHGNELILCNNLPNKPIEEKRPSETDMRNFTSIDTSSLEDNERRLFEAIFPFAEKFRQKFQATLRKQIETYREGGGIMSDRIKDYLLEKDMLLPRLDICSGEAALSFLQKTNLLDTTKFEVGKDLMLVFQLPKPLAQFWWKGDTSGSSKGVNVDLDGVGVEWGKFYHDIMPIVWEFIGEIECESNVYMVRVNDCGQHDPNLYYYVWKIVEWDNNQRL